MKIAFLTLVLCMGMQTITAGQSKNLVSGRVLDFQDLPISGANLQILNSNQYNIADANGTFQFNSLPDGKYFLKISAIGYATITMPLSIPSAEALTFRLSAKNLKLDEVIVSAQKREENIQNLPLSITAFSAAQVQDWNMMNIKDIKTIVPNLSAGNPGDGRNVVSIRGIANTSYDPSVATYIDGVNQFGLDTYISQLLDVERIEVLRGPQGTLYGRNAMGGVINIITKQPSNQTRGFAGFNMGSYGEERYTLGIRTPLIEDRLYFGASGLYNKLNGYYENTLDNTNFDKQRAVMGNYFLKYLANDKLSIVLNVKHNANRNNGAFPLTGTISEALENPFKVSQNATGQLSDNLFNVSLSANYTGQNYNLSSQTAFQSNYRYYKNPVDGDFSNLDGYAIVNNYGKKWNKVQVLTQEFKISSPANLDSKFSWTAGIYGFYQYNPVKQGIHVGSDGELMGAGMSDFTSINTNTGNSIGLATYAQVSYAITSTIKAAVGIRNDYEYKKLKGFSEFFMDGEEAAITLGEQASEATFHAFSPTLNLAWQASKNNDFYGSYSRGFRAGGINQTGDQALRFLSYQPEYSNNFEIGNKNTFLNNRLRINLAAFYSQLTDAQVPTLILPEAITLTQNAGKLISKGVEAELSSNPVKGLNLDASFGYTDASYARLKLGDNGQELNYDGNKQIFTPDLTAMLALQYTYELTDFHQLNLTSRLEWQHVGNQYFDAIERQNRLY